MMTVMKRTLTAALALTALSLGIWTLRPEPVDAQRANRPAVYITQATVPRNMEVSALVNFGRSHAARRLNETTGVPLNERMWNAKLIINFGRALGDVQYDVLYYDVTQRRTLITTQEIFVNDRTQQAFVNPVRLRRPQFSPGQKLEIVVTVRHREVASTRTELNGEVPQNSGEVDFTQGGEAP